MPQWHTYSPTKGVFVAPSWAVLPPVLKLWISGRTPSHPGDAPETDVIAEQRRSSRSRSTGQDPLQEAQVVVSVEYIKLGSPLDEHLRRVCSTIRFGTRFPRSRSEMWLWFVKQRAASCSWENPAPVHSDLRFPPNASKIPACSGLSGPSATCRVCDTRVSSVGIADALDRHPREQLRGATPIGGDRENAFSIHPPRATTNVRL